MPQRLQTRFGTWRYKPSKPGAVLDGRIDGGQVNLQGATLRFLIAFRWDLNPNDSEVPVNAPKWLDSDRFDVLAKIAPETWKAMEPHRRTSQMRTWKQCSGHC